MGIGEYCTSNCLKIIITIFYRFNELNYVLRFEITFSFQLNWNVVDLNTFISIMCVKLCTKPLYYVTSIYKLNTLKMMRCIECQREMWWWWWWCVVFFFVVVSDTNMFEYVNSPTRHYQFVQGNVLYLVVNLVVE